MQEHAYFGKQTIEWYYKVVMIFLSVKQKLSRCINPTVCPLVAVGALYQSQGLRDGAWLLFSIRYQMSVRDKVIDMLKRGRGTRYGISKDTGSSFAAVDRVICALIREGTVVEEQINSNLKLVSLREGPK